MIGLSRISSLCSALLSVCLLLKYAKLSDSVLATPVRAAGVALGEFGWALLRGTACALAFTLVMVCMGLVESLWAVLAVPVACWSASRSPPSA